MIQNILTGKEFNSKYDCNELVMHTDEKQYSGCVKIEMGLNKYNDNYTDYDVFPFDGYYCTFGNIKYTPYDEYDYYKLGVIIPDDARVVVLLTENPQNSGSTLIRIKTNMINVKTTVLTFTIDNFENYKYFCLSGIPEELQTKELCEKFVKCYGNNLEYVPHNLKTLEMCTMAIRDGDVNRCCDYPRAISFVPDDIITLDLCKLSLEHGTSLVRGDYPKRFRIYALYLHAVQNCRCFLSDIPIQHRTYEVCEIAIKNNGYLVSVPNELRTIEICNLAVTNNNGNNIKDVPVNLITRDMCLAAAINNCDVINIPKEFMDAEICELSVLNGREYDIMKTVKSIPQDQFTDNVFYNLIEKAKSEERLKLHSNNIKKFCESIPKHLWSRDSCKALIECYRESIKYIPSEFVSNEQRIDAFVNGVKVYRKKIQHNKFFTCETCISHLKNGGSIKNIPKDKLSENHSILCETAIKSNHYQLNELPKEYLTYELCILAVQCGCELDSEYGIPEKFIDEGLVREYLLKHITREFVVPPKLLTTELYLLWCKHQLYSHNITIKHIPTNRVEAIASVILNPKMIDKIDKSFVDSEMCMFAKRNIL